MAGLTPLSPEDLGIPPPMPASLGALPALPNLGADAATRPGVWSGIGGPQPAMPSLPADTSLKPLVTNPRQLQQQQIQQKINELQNPAKPQGFWQNLRHGLAVAGNIAGDVVDPGAMQLIPGTQLYKNATIRNLQGQQQQLRADDIQDKDEAQKAERNAVLNEATRADTANIKSETAARDNAPEKPVDLSGAYSNAVQSALAKGQDPMNDPVVQHIAEAIQNIQKQPAEKPESREDKAVAIYAKPEAERTPEEQAFIKGYEHDIKVSKTDPGVARTSVLLQMPTAIADPNNPGGVIYSTRRGAIGQEAPTGIDTVVPKSVAKDFTSGTDAHTLTNINTADAHIQQLGHIAQALRNGNVQLLNRAANAYATATGEAAPLNFQLLKTALAAELAKTTTGGAATVEETKELTKALNAANSPDQIAGVTQNASALMHSKREQLQTQYRQGMSGQPNFGGMMRARDLQGRLHEAPAGTPLPPGWKAEAK